MDTEYKKPMNEDQLEYVKKEIIKSYFFLISHTTHDPGVIEIMKLSALSDAQKGTRQGNLGR